MEQTQDTTRSLIFENASSLLDEAMILFDHGKYARASALAIISIEESGKCKLFDHAIADAKKLDSSKTIPPSQADYYSKL